MKCPKCGYNSFESNDVCKKCANDLSGYKQTYGLKAIVLPQEIRTDMARKLTAEVPVADHVPETHEPETDMFSFDLPDETAAGSAAAAPPAADPFSFITQPEAQSDAFGGFSFDEEPSSPKAPADDAAFGSLLESTPHVKTASSATTPAKAAPADSFGEFELENFSWDDTPETPAGGDKKEDDFSNLFGESDSAKK